MLCKCQVPKSRNCSENATVLHKTNTVQRSLGKTEAVPIAKLIGCLSPPMRSIGAERRNDVDKNLQQTRDESNCRVQSANVHTETIVEPIAIVKSQNLTSKESRDVIMQDFDCCPKCSVFTKSKIHNIYSLVFIEIKSQFMYFLTLLVPKVCR